MGIFDWGFFPLIPPGQSGQCQVPVHRWTFSEHHIVGEDL